MSSVRAVLTGISIACIAAGVLLLVAQVRHRPADLGPFPSGNGSEPPRGAEPGPTPAAGGRVASSRHEVTRRRRILATLLVTMVASLAAGLVVQERWVWGVHLFLDNAFLGYVAWLARRAETRARAAVPPSEPPESSPAAELPPRAGLPEAPEAQDAEEGEEAEEAEEGEEAEEVEEVEVTDART